ncbi:MAG: trehalose 6-phosphate synthase, partial [Woeseiaceae bacterium]|nr:trehalose 6-phosphate synthase [Woeseiaceae bacterium]
MILTSAPLEDIGLADISIFPPGYFIYAGAKGRKYIDMQGKRKQYLIKAERQAKLDIINKWLI